MDCYDVLVVGAGLAGLSCARFLSRRGAGAARRAKASLDDGVHTTGIFVRRTFEDFPLPADCLGPPVRDVELGLPLLRVFAGQIFFSRGSFPDIDLPPSPAPHKR